MKNKDLKLNVGDLSSHFKKLASTLNAYKIFAFFLFVAAIYGYILWRINVFSNTPANPDKEAAQTVAQPHIDPAIVAKIKSLQDHSVSVQSLFDDARQNPFQE